MSVILSSGPKARAKDLASASTVSAAETRSFASLRMTAGVDHALYAGTGTFGRPAKAIASSCWL